MHRVTVKPTSMKVFWLCCRGAPNPHITMKMMGTNRRAHSMSRVLQVRSTTHMKSQAVNLTSTQGRSRTGAVTTQVHPVMELGWLMIPFFLGGEAAKPQGGSLSLCVCVCVYVYMYNTRHYCCWCECRI